MSVVQCCPTSAVGPAQRGQLLQPPLLGHHLRLRLLVQELELAQLQPALQ